MLIEFSVGNYKSFNDIVRFSMVAAKIKSKDRELDKSNVFMVDDDLSLLKSAAIYGANASGKSNFTTALRFMREMVLESSKETQASEPINVDVFRLNCESKLAPASFELVFILGGMKYRYGFKVTHERIISEWLFYVPKTKEANLFTRELDIIKLSPKFKEGKGIEGKTRGNALFLSVVAQFNGEIAQEILSWFYALSIISGLSDRGYREYTVTNYQNNRYKKDILSFLNSRAKCNFEDRER